MRFAIAVAVAAAACSNLLGVHDPTAAPGDGSGVGSGTFSFQLAPAQSRVGLGRSAGLPITVERGAAFTDAIDFALRDPPAGVSLDALELAPGDSTGSATLTVTVGAAVGAPSLEVIGVGGGVTVSQTFQIAIVDPPGALDPAFGTGGSVTTSFVGKDGEILGGALLSTGDVLFGGVSVDATGASEDLAFGEVTATGVPVPGLGADGTVVTTTPLSLSATSLATVSRATDNANSDLPLFAITEADGSLGFHCYGPDGMPSPSFGPTMAGVFTLSLGSGVAAVPSSVTQSGNDFVYASGVAEGSDSSFGFLAQIMPGGLAKGIFANGFVSFGSNTVMFDVVEGSNHDVFGIGSTLAAPEDDDVLVVEVDLNGQAVSTFGSAGQITIDFGGDEHGTSAVRAPDGSLYVAFITSQVGVPRAAVVHLAANGAIDRSFGMNGVVTFDQPQLHPAGTASLALGATGELYVVIEVISGTGATSMAALDGSGALDLAFGDDQTGIATLAIGSDSILGATLGVGSDGDLVLAGTAATATGAQPQAFVAKLFP